MNIQIWRQNWNCRINAIYCTVPRLIRSDSPFLVERQSSWVNATAKTCPALDKEVLEIVIAKHTEDNEVLEIVIAKHTEDSKDCQDRIEANNCT